MTPVTLDLFLAAVEGLPAQGIDRGARHALQGVLPVIIGALGLLFIFVIWAVFFRKSEGRRERGRILEGPPERSVDRNSSRRRRRRREKQRPRNPTLSETGGLPPVRDDQAPPPV
jgi:hypothetical protein